MKIIVCPWCEKKLKLPEGFSKPVVPPKPKRDEEDLVELELDDRIDEKVAAKIPDDDFFEEDARPRRSAERSPRSGLRPTAPRRKRESSSSGMWIGFGVGGGVSLLAVLLFVYFNRDGEAPNNPAMNNNNAVSNIAQQPPVANVPNGANPAIPANPALPNVAPMTSAPATPNAVSASQNPPMPAILAEAAPSNAAAPIPAPTVPAPNSVQPIPPAIAASPNGALRYKWQPNREYSYKFSIEANLGQVIERTEGLCSYRVSPQPAGPTIEFRQQGTGTAFVVSADGFLLTCAHVVDAAKTIEVQLGGQKYPATVVSADKVHDVALIRINAQNLTPAPLADSNAVKSTLGFHQYRFQRFDCVESWAELALTAFLYLEWFRVRQLTRRGLTEKDRAWWQSQRTFGLCQAIRQVSQRAELSYVADRLKTPGGIQKLNRLIDHSFPSEYRVAM